MKCEAHLNIGFFLLLFFRLREGFEESSAASGNLTSGKNFFEGFDLMFD